MKRRHKKMARCMWNKSQRQFVSSKYYWIAHAWVRPFRSVK